MFFLTGCHGVGKSTICQYIQSKTAYVHIKASDLIYENPRHMPPQDKRVASIRDIANNQGVLLNAVEKYQSTDKLLLEGHCCLLRRSGNVDRIPLQVFEQLNLSGIILISRPIHFVQNDLKTKRGIHYTYTELYDLQSEEVLYSKKIADHLNVPYMHGDLGKDSLSHVVDDILSFMRSKRSFNYEL